MSKYQKLMADARERMTYWLPEDLDVDWIGDIANSVADALVASDTAGADLVGLIAGQRSLVTSQEVQMHLVEALRIHISDSMTREFERRADELRQPATP